MQDWLTRYRLAAFLAGGLCVTAAAFIGWSLLGRSAAVEPDPFADLEIELGEPDVSLKTADAPLLTIPDQHEPALDSTAWPMIEADPSATGAIPAHFSSAGLSVSEPVTPVWLLGTIQPLEEITAPSVVPMEVRQAVGTGPVRR